MRISNSCFQRFFSKKSNLSSLKREGDMMRKIKLLCSVVLSAIIPMAYASTQAERIAELEYVALYEPSDWIDENEVVPTPEDAKKKFNLTDADFYADIMFLANKYSNTETNKERRICRSSAIGWLGVYGSTNDLPFLASIKTNKLDYAQEAAIFATLNISKRENSFISTAREIVTNTNLYSKGVRGLIYCHLHNMCKKENVYVHVADELVRNRIAAFFLERATCEVDSTLYVDEVACRLNPSYRHSQQRRDNLARLRKPGLTGLPAQIYDAAQRDALPKEEE